MSDGHVSRDLGQRGCGSHRRGHGGGHGKGGCRGKRKRGPGGACGGNDRCGSRWPQTRGPPQWGAKGDQRAAARHERCGVKGVGPRSGGVPGMWKRRGGPKEGHGKHAAGLQLGNGLKADSGGEGVGGGGWVRGLWAGTPAALGWRAAGPQLVRCGPATVAPAARPHGLHCSLSSSHVRPASGLACVPNSSRSLPPWLGSELWASGSGLYRLVTLHT